MLVTSGLSGETVNGDMVPYPWAFYSGERKVANRTPGRAIRNRRNAMRPRETSAIEFVSELEVGKSEMAVAEKGESASVP